MGAGVGADVEYLARVLVLPRVDLRDVRWHVFFEGRALPACEPPARDDDGIRLDKGTVGSLNNPRSVPPFGHLCCATAEPTRVCIHV